MSETMNTGDVSRRLGIPVTAELLTELGFEPVGRDKRAVLWAPEDYPKMCDAVGKYIAGRKNVPMQPKPERQAKPTKSKTPVAGKPLPPSDDDDEEL